MSYVKPANKDNTLVSTMDSRSSTKLFIVSKACRVKPNPSHLHFLDIATLGSTEKICLAFGQHSVWDPCPTPTHTLELGLSTHGGRTRSGMEPSIATSVDDTPCLNIYAPLYMVLNFLGPSILIVQICFVCKGEDYKAMEYCGAVLSKIQG